MYSGIFNELSRQHTALVYERSRLRALRAQRANARHVDRGHVGAPYPEDMETDFDINLQAKIDALTEALRGLAKLLDLL